jgi:hypothetical protein
VNDDIWTKIHQLVRWPDEKAGLARLADVASLLAPGGTRR